VVGSGDRPAGWVVGGWVPLWGFLGSGRWVGGCPFGVFCLKKKTIHVEDTPKKSTKFRWQFPPFFFSFVSFFSLSSLSMGVPKKNAPGAIELLPKKSTTFVSPWRAGPGAGFYHVQGAEKKMKKNSQCTYVLYLARIELLYTYDDVIFFIAFLSSPHRETPKTP
jgi:hypothetical protein